MLNYQNDSNVRLIKNNTGADVGQYQVLKLDGPVFSPTDNATGWLQRQTFKGITPTASCDFAITQRAAPNGKTQPALFSGVSPCTINVTDAAHTHAVAGTTAAKLVSATSGPAKILWKESGTGDKDAVVQLSQSGSAGAVTSWASCDFLYTGSGSSDGTNNLATPSNRYTSDSTIIDFSTHPRILTGGYFFYHVDGTINFDYPERHINDYELNGITRYMKQSGNKILSAAGGAIANTSVTFTDTFDSIPSIALSITSWGNAGIPIIRASSVSTGGFTLVMTNKDATNATGNVTIEWTAFDQFDDGEASFDNMHIMSDHFVSSKLYGNSSNSIGATDFQLNDRVSHYNSTGTLEGNVNFSYSGWYEATANPYPVQVSHFYNTTLAGATTNWSNINSVEGSLTLMAADSSPNENEVAEAPP